MKRMKDCWPTIVLTATVLFGGACATTLTDHAAWIYPHTDALQQGMAGARARGLVLTDYHIHLRGGMTARKAAERQQQSGIRSGVLENYGREWPLHDKASLAAFIDEARSVQADARRLPVGIQVNDRDWYQQIEPELFAQLDFVLADTMIMGVGADGKPRRLWLPDVTIDDPEAWMRDYLAHNLRILDEPISILANPTYLPPCISNRYDQLWTEARMRQVIPSRLSSRLPRVWGRPSRSAPTITTTWSRILRAGLRPSVNSISSPKICGRSLTGLDAHAAAALTYPASRHL